MSVRDGARGWDAYAPFYDWENAQTVARRDVAFWCRLAAAQPGPILELGLRHRAHRAARRQVRHAPRRHRSLGADAGAGAPTAAARQAGRSRAARPRRHPCAAVSSSHGVRLRDGALRDAAVADARTRSAGRRSRRSRGCSAAGGCSRSISCPTCPAGRNTAGARACVGTPWRRGTLTLVESVRQEQRRGLTIFDQEYVERRGRTRRVHRFALTFRTLSVPADVAPARTGRIPIDAVLGDYQGGPWDERADTWVILARRPARIRAQGAAVHGSRSSRSMVHALQTPDP